MEDTARRRLFVSATAVFAALMLAALAVIAHDGVSGAINRALFGLLLVLWSLALTGFPFALVALLRGTAQAARSRRSGSLGRLERRPLRPSATLELGQQGSATRAKVD